MLVKTYPYSLAYVCLGSLVPQHLLHIYSAFRFYLIFYLLLLRRSLLPNQKLYFSSIRCFHLLFPWLEHLLFTAFFVFLYPFHLFYSHSSFILSKPSEFVIQICISYLSCCYYPRFYFSFYHLSPVMR